MEIAAIIVPNSGAVKFKVTTETSDNQTVFIPGKFNSYLKIDPNYTPIAIEKQLFR